MIRFRCKKCGKKLKADDEIIGRKVKCTRCEKVTRVPKTDNLAKVSTRPLDDRPQQVEAIGEEPDIGQRFVWDEPDSSAESIDSDERASSLLAEGSDDDSLILNGTSSAIGTDRLSTSRGKSEFSIHVDVDRTPAPPDDFEPRFKVVQRGSSPLKKWLVFAVLGIVLVGGIAGVLTYLSGGNSDSGPAFTSDFESMPHVMDYRRAEMLLEKSDRFLTIASQATRSGPKIDADEAAELTDLHASVAELTQNSTVLTDVSKLMTANNTTDAKTLLLKSTRTLDEKRAEVDKKTRSFRQ